MTFHRLSIGLALALPLLTWQTAARATCDVDSDCPAAACGGQVCEWSMGVPVGCMAAGTDPQGSDGWCDTDTDCKCMTEGATCSSAHHCTFTLPKDTDGGVLDASASEAGADAAPGTDASTSDEGGVLDAGALDSAQGGGGEGGPVTVPDRDANVSPPDAGSDASTNDTSGGSSGCSLSASSEGPAGPWGIGLTGGVIGLAIVRSRRRRVGAASPSAESTKPMRVKK